MLGYLDTIIALAAILLGVSLIVTTLTQSLSAVLALRGANLRWGVATLLKELDPTLAPHADTIGSEVLRHPLISDSIMSDWGSLFDRWKWADAIHKDELVGVLRLLAEPTAGGAAAPAWRAALATALEPLEDGAADAITQAAPEIRKLLGRSPHGEEAVLAALVSSAELLPRRIDQWFDSIMARVSARFTTQTRVWTILFSFAAAFAMHLDTLQLIRLLSADSALRSRVIASSDALTRKAGEILAASDQVPATAYVLAMKQLIDHHRDVLHILDEPRGFSDLDAARVWLDQQLAAAQLPTNPAWWKEYVSLLPQAQLLGAAEDIRSIVGGLPITLIPNPYPRPFYNYWTPSWSHLWGIFASAALLSLGAPFWYNALRTLCSLRPAVSQKGAPAPPEAPAKG